MLTVRVMDSCSCCVPTLIDSFFRTAFGAQSVTVGPCPLLRTWPGKSRFSECQIKVCNKGLRKVVTKHEMCYLSWARSSYLLRKERRLYNTMSWRDHPDHRERSDHNWSPVIRLISHVLVPSPALLGRSWALPAPLIVFLSPHPIVRNIILLDSP